MYYFFLFNLCCVIVQIIFFIVTFHVFKDHFANEKESIQKEGLWISLIACTCFFFVTASVLFWWVNSTDPGWSKSLPKALFYIYLDRAIKESRNLDYFCFFCRTLWSSTGVHCMTCGACVEGFDHHCTFVNNCIGYNNHARFMNFLGMAFVYCIFQILTIIMVVYQNWHHCHSPAIFHRPDDMEFCSNEFDLSLWIISAILVMLTLL